MKRFRNIFLTIENAINSITSNENKEEVTLFFNKLPALETSYDFKNNEYVNTPTRMSKESKSKFVYKIFNKDDKCCFSVEYYTTNSRFWGSYKKEKSFNFYVSEQNEIYYCVSQFLNEREFKTTSYKFQNGELTYIKKFLNNPHKTDVIETELSRKTKDYALGSKTYTSKETKAKMVIKYDIELKDDSEFSLDLLNSKYAKQRIIPNDKTKTALK